MRRRLRNPWLALLPAGLIGTLAVAGAAQLAAQSGAAATPPVMPRYDADGALHLPDDYLRWTFVGASLGLSYNDEPPRRESFNHTLMEPTAYDHFVRTGAFREGTMLALLVRRTEADAMPGAPRAVRLRRPGGGTGREGPGARRGRLGLLRLRRRRPRPDDGAAAAAGQPLSHVPRRARGARQRVPAVLPPCWPTRRA